MAFYAVYVRDQAIHQVARERNNPHVFLIEAAAKQATGTPPEAPLAHHSAQRGGGR